MTDEELIKKIRSASGSMAHQWHYGYAEALNEAADRLKQLKSQNEDLENTVVVLSGAVEKYKEKYGGLEEWTERE